MLHRRRMTHVRTAGTTWLVCGLLGAGVSLFDLARNLASGAFDGTIASDLIAAIFCLAGAFAGYGLTARGCAVLSRRDRCPQPGVASRRATPG